MRLSFQLYPSVDLHIFGRNWDAANAAALKILANDPDAFFVHPFNQV